MVALACFENKGEVVAKTLERILNNNKESPLIHTNARACLEHIKKRDTNKVSPELEKRIKELIEVSIIEVSIKEASAAIQAYKELLSIGEAIIPY